MKTALIFLSAMFLSSAHAAVENILSMQRDSNGNFSVMCEGAGGIVSFNSGINANLIRTDQVCGAEVEPHEGMLEEGLYSSTSDFCSQTVKWNGAQLNIALSSPCTGVLVMDKFEDGWYRGKITGYEYVYELEVKSSTSYVFHSRSFASSGEFTKSGGDTQQPNLVKRGADPVGL